MWQDWKHLHCKPAVHVVRNCLATACVACSNQAGLHALLKLLGIGIVHISCADFAGAVAPDAASLAAVAALRR